MKKLASIFFTVAFTSAVLIGCDFVDSNSSYVESDSPAHVEASYNGIFAAPNDTSGYDDWYDD